MRTTFESISRQVFVMPADQRMRLALALMESVEAGDAASAGAAWSDEISRRMEAYDSGESRAVPAAEVFRKLREIAPDR